MSQKLKAFCPALIAVLAISAVISSVAQATIGTFTAPAYPTVTKGTQIGTTDYFQATECEVAIYQATLSESSHELTVTPHYSDCVTPGTFTIATFSLNGCHFLFKTSDTTVSGATPGTADLVCPQGKQIEISVFSGLCKVDIPAQMGLTGITFTNKGSNTVTVDVDITNQITYTNTKISIFCPLAGNIHAASGNFVSVLTFEGFDDHGSTTGGPTGASPTYNTGAPRNIDVG